MRVGSTCPTLRSKHASWRVAHLAARLQPTGAVTRPPRREVLIRDDNIRRERLCSRGCRTHVGPRWRNGGPAKSSSRDQLRPETTRTGLVSPAALLRQIGVAFAHTPGLPTGEQLAQAA